MLWVDMAADLDVLIDELYALPLEQFVPERDVLARQLRADGRREDARTIAALSKPSVAAWAVNQVVRSQRDAAAALWEAGDAVLDVQARVVAGEAGGAELRTAIEAQRAALTPLADAARGLMTGAGKFLGEQNVQAVIESLHAAAIDPAARPAVAAARLVRPMRLTGLEAALATGAPAPRRAPEPDPEAQAAATRTRIAEREHEDAQTEVERRRAAREERARRQAAERALARAEREREKARERIAAAVRRRDDALKAAERARRALDAAETEVDAAEEALAGAHQDLEDAEDAVDRAREDLGPA